MKLGVASGAMDFLRNPRHFSRSQHKLEPLDLRHRSCDGLWQQDHQKHPKSKMSPDQIVKDDDL